MKRRLVDKHRLALHKAADADRSGFDWRGVSLDDPWVALLAQQDHTKGVEHPGLGCCE